MISTKFLSRDKRNGFPLLPRVILPRCTENTSPQNLSKYNLKLQKYNTKLQCAIIRVLLWVAINKLAPKEIYRTIVQENTSFKRQSAIRGLSWLLPATVGKVGWHLGPRELNPSTLPGFFHLFWAFPFGDSQ